MEQLPRIVGLRVDILDDEGIWNTGRIASIDEADNSMVEICYDGWGAEYNEWIDISSQRLAPFHMYTIVKKCWAKLNKYPWWPAFVILRAPTTKQAEECLQLESKVYVEFADSIYEYKRSRCWMQRKNVSSFSDDFDIRASKSVGKNFHEYVEATQRALAGSSDVKFTTTTGTMPCEYDGKPPLSVAKQIKKHGEEKWYEAYEIFHQRYSMLYGLDKDLQEKAPEDSTNQGTDKSKKGKRPVGRPKAGGKTPAKFNAKESSAEREEGDEEVIEIIEEDEGNDQDDEDNEDNNDEEEAEKTVSSRGQKKRKAAPSAKPKRETSVKRGKGRAQRVKG